MSNGSDERRRVHGFTISLLGDVMLGRLIDQLLPTHVDEPGEADIVSNFRASHQHLQTYTHASPWGNSLSLFKRSDIVLGNLETSATVHDKKWPDKVFNYRMHPENLQCLKEAKISYVSLANNHTLDFGIQGLLDTVRALKQADIEFAGAGETKTEADQPARLCLTHKNEEEDASTSSYDVHVYSFSDHPSHWANIEQFNHLQYSSAFRQHLKSRLTQRRHPALKIVSVHWGPNYRWHPDDQIQAMAHFLIESCGVDVVWGHSSHHVQGVEVFQGKLIIYGCGDFVDDYAVNHEYRNDLSAAWNLKVQPGPPDVDGRLAVRRLEVWPNRIKHFQAGLLDSRDADHTWVVNKFTTLSRELGTTVDHILGQEGQIVVDMDKQAT